MDFIGIDLHKNASQVCILTEDGELIERRIKTDRESFDELFSERPPARGSGRAARARSLMVEAAWSLLRWKTERTKALHEWWARIAQRRGKATAVVALARKLAGIMFAVWRDGTQFDPLLLRPGDQAAVT
jgi:hypothetical protein